MKQTAIEWLIDQLEKYELYSKISFQCLKEIEQASLMHKQEMCEFAEYVATYPDKNRNVNGEMLHAKSKYDGAERTIDLLETFKK